MQLGATYQKACSVSSSLERRRRREQELQHRRRQLAALQRREGERERRRGRGGPLGARRAQLPRSRLRTRTEHVRELAEEVGEGAVARNFLLYFRLGIYYCYNNKSEYE
jgi:hypothetical protein